MMSGSWLVRVVLATNACASLWPMPALAHDVPPDRPIPGYVKVGPDSVQLLVRIALDTLRLPLPTTDGRINVDASVPRLQDELLKFSEAVRVFEGRSPLEPAKRELRLSLPSDRSFNSYPTASAHLESSVPSASAIYANQGFLDARLTYRIHAQGMLSIQSRFTDTWGSAPELSLIVFPIEGDARRYAIGGSSGRVVFNPTRYEAVRRSFVAGLMIVLESAEHLMLLICLIVPLRTVRSIAPVVVAAVAGFAAAAVVSGLALIRVDAAFTQVVAASTTVVIAAAAVFNLVEPAFLRRWVFAALAGVICGFASADALRGKLLFAGAHSILSAFALNIGIASAQVFLAAVLAVWAQLLVHRSATARIRVLLISAIVADIAWHWATERAAPLWQAGWDHSGPSLLILARAVAGVLLVVSVAGYLVRAAHSREGTMPVQHAPDSGSCPPERSGFPAS